MSAPEMRLSVSASCERRLPSPVLAAVTAAAAGTGVVVVPGPCLGACGDDTRLALTGAGRWSWLFQGLDAETDMPAFSLLLAAWLAALDGLAAKADRKALLVRTVGRVPPQ
jgi:predicted metal-binding protein